MPSVASDLLKLELQTTGENVNAWGDKLNTLFTSVEQAVASIYTLTITGDYPLSSTNYVANEYRRHALKLVGSPVADFTITVPAVSFPYRVINQTGKQATIKTASGIGGIVRAGRTTTVLCDGTDCTALDPTLDQIKTAAGPVNFGGNRQINVGASQSDTDGINRGEAIAFTAAGVQLASDWAQKTSGSVDGASGYSARAWATSTTALTGGLKGALGYANDASASATAAGTSAGNASASAGNAAGSATLAQQWAVTTGSQVAATDYSAKEYAVGTTVPAGSAKAWATSTAAVSGGLKGALGYAQDASGSATSAASSATAAQAAVGAVKVTTNDTTASVLASALVAGSNVSFTVTNPGGDEKLTIASNAPAAPPVASLIGLGVRHFSPLSTGTFGANPTTVNLLYALPIAVGRATTYSGIAAFVNDAATGLARLGLYADRANGGPGVRIVDAGTVATDTSGEKIASITQTLTPALYWLLLVCNAAPNFRTHDPFTAFAGGLNYSAGKVTGLTRSFTFGTLPADETSATYSPISASFPVIALVPSS